MNSDSAEKTDRPKSKESASPSAHDKAYSLLHARMPKGQVLDIPCGSGSFTRRLLEGGYEVAAADIAAHPAVPQVPFQAADMNQPLPFLDASFDAVASIEGIEHIERPYDFLRECRRVLRPGGFLLLTTPNISSLRSRWRWFLTGFHNKCKYPLDETDPQPRHHIAMLSYPQTRYMLHTNGFRIQTITTNQIKSASRLYFPWAAVSYLATKLILPRGARGENHAAVIRDAQRHMLSTPLLFGETMIVIAQAHTKK
ncbi:MAG: class I SAM-dependent methyltransferase [Candidatus Hydrogenedentes bacterium]|nr:class I SAM-dependent methyltransferase [Candidatus Hydrogenedentota bacterium]